MKYLIALVLIAGTDQQEYYHMQEQFVSESQVTDEIREDLFRLGWLVVADSEDSD